MRVAPRLIQTPETLACTRGCTAVKHVGVAILPGHPARPCAQLRLSPSWAHPNESRER